MPRRIPENKVWLLIAVFAVGFYVPTLPADSLSVHFTFAPSDVRIRPDGSFSRVELVDEPTSIFEAGQPWLPAKTVMIAVPEGAAVRGVRFSHYDTPLIEGINVFPFQPPVTSTNKSPAPAVPPDPERYTSHTMFPGHAGVDGGIHTMRGQSMVAVTLYPVRYFPADRNRG